MKTRCSYTESPRTSALNGHVPELYGSDDVTEIVKPRHFIDNRMFHWLSTWWISKKPCINTKNLQQAKYPQLTQCAKWITIHHLLDYWEKPTTWFFTRYQLPPIFAENLSTWWPPFRVAWDLPSLVPIWTEVGSPVLSEPAKLFPKVFCSARQPTVLRFNRWIVAIFISCSLQTFPSAGFLE